MSRALGMASSCSSLKFCRTREAAVSTTGDSPVMVTVSSTAATVRSTFTVAVNPSEMSMPSRLSVAKPGSAYTTVYMP